jgi:hypothetical protein
MSELIDPAAQEAFVKYDSNMTWYRNNYNTLKQKHEGELVLIIDENKEPEFFQDILQLRERLKKSDIDTRSIVIEYIGDGNIGMMA